VVTTLETARIDIRTNRRPTRRVHRLFHQPRNASRQWQMRLVSIAVLLSIMAGVISPVAASPGRPVASNQSAVSAPASETDSGSGGIAAETNALSLLPSAATNPVPCDSLSADPVRFKDTGLVDCLQYSNQHI